MNTKIVRYYRESTSGTGELYDPGFYSAAVRRADVRHDRAVHSHRADRPTLGEFPGNPGRDVTSRRDPADDVDDVTAEDSPSSDVVVEPGSFL